MQTQRNKIWKWYYDYVVSEKALLDLYAALFDGWQIIR